MTIFNFIKFVIILLCLMGSVFVGAGAWKIWSAFCFAQSAQKVQGTFIGYHDVMADSTIKDSSGFKIKVEETYPLFAYCDNKGQTHNITGSDLIVWQWLKSGDQVDVLVSPDDPENARLAAPYYLYGSGGFLSLGGLLSIILLVYGLKVLALYIGPAAPLSQTGLLAMAQELAKKKLPLGDLVIVGGGFFVLSGAMIGFGTHLIFKRQDPALIQAMEAGKYDTARLLAIKGKGIEGKNKAGETALIVALKANKPEVTRAILSHWTSINVLAANGASALSLAAANSDHQTLTIMIKKGAETFGLNPSIIRDLISKGDRETLEVIFNSSINLDTEFRRLTYGDLAVLHGQAEVVHLIQSQNGPFKAPSSFIALVLDDSTMLSTALKQPAACHIKFNRLTLSQFAEKTGKQEQLAKAGGCIEGK